MRKPFSPKISTFVIMRVLFKAKALLLVGSILGFACKETNVSPSEEVFSEDHTSIVSESGAQPNELGMIPILAYHKLGDEDTEYTRSRDGFRQDMESIINGNFHPISLDEFRTGKISTPRGKIPILLTFDDSSISQFEMNPDGSIHPDSVVGILEDLRKKYKTFSPLAVFFVLPGAKSPNNYFGQNEFQKTKTDFLLSNGYSIENHTMWHANLKQYSHLIEEQIVKTDSFVKKLAPNYKMTSLALPFGIYPLESDRHRLMKGNYQGTSYQYELVFDFSNRLSFSPYSIKFDPLYVRRIHGNKTQVEKMFRDIQKKNVAFISDGDPNTISVPKNLKGQIHAKWKKNIRIID